MQLIDAIIIDGGRPPQEKRGCCGSGGREANETIRVHILLLYEKLQMMKGLREMKDILFLCKLRLDVLVRVCREAVCCLVFGFVLARFLVNDNDGLVAEFYILLYGNTGHERTM